MKKRYILLLSVFFAEICIVSLLDGNNIKFESWIENAIGTLIFLLPIQILLFLLGKDMQFSQPKRICFKIAFWFISLCYFLGAVVTLI